MWGLGDGSLMWNPGFPFEERSRALLIGRHRRLCVVSRQHRGTAARPGLVMGLHRGGSCRRIASRVHAAADAAPLASLAEGGNAPSPQSDDRLVGEKVINTS